MEFGKYGCIDRLHRYSIKERADAGEVSIGMVVNIPSPFMAELAALAGCDFIRIDLEHNAFNPETVQNIIRAADACGIASYARLDQYDLIAPLLDFGIEGFMFPHVRSAEQAKLLVDKVKYAPVGRRGFASAGRAQRFGTMPFDKYAEEASKDVFLQVQIEDKEGIEHMEEIIATPGLDYICSGRGDIAQALGLLGQGGGPEAGAVEDRIVETAKKYNLRCQFSIRTPEQLIDYYNRGVRTFTIGDDRDFILEGVRDRVNLLRSTADSIK